MKGFLICCFLLFYLTLFSQSNKFISFSGDNLAGISTQSTIKVTDSLSMIRVLEQLKLKAIRKGFLLASFDSIHPTEEGWNCTFYQGNEFKTLQLITDEETTFFLRKHGRLTDRMLSTVPLRPAELGKILELILSCYLNNGYPFAQIAFTSIDYQGNTCSAKLSVEKGLYLNFSQIHLKGDTAVSSRFISSLIDLSEGEPFNEEKLKLISAKLKQVPFIKEIKPHELLFSTDGVELFMYLETNTVSSVNGAVGLQPDPVSGRVGLTGELNLKLLNLLKRGELIQLNWRSIQVQTQSLFAQLNYPFLFNTPFGFDGQFQLYKRDTTFLELKTTIGIQYSLKNGSFVKAFYQNYSSNLLSGAALNPTFASLSSINANAYGLSLTRRQFDYLPNPSKGSALQVEVAIGNRKSTLSDTSETVRSTTYRGLVHLEWFVPITRRNVIRLANRTEFYFAPELVENELYRFGGQSSLRGFNEEEFFATSRSVLSIEYRFLVDRNSHAFAFFDQGWYEKKTLNYSRDTPFGFGAGFSFGTKFGIFSIAYALGKQQSNPILLSNGKVHFGYITYF